MRARSRAAADPRKQEWAMDFIIDGLAKSTQTGSAR